MFSFVLFLSTPRIRFEGVSSGLFFVVVVSWHNATRSYATMYTSQLANERQTMQISHEIVDCLLLCQCMVNYWHPIRIEITVTLGFGLIKILMNTTNGLYRQFWKKSDIKLIYRIYYTDCIEYMNPHEQIRPICVLFVPVFFFSACHNISRIVSASLELDKFFYSNIWTMQTKTKKHSRKFRNWKNEENHY